MKKLIALFIFPALLFCTCNVFALDLTKRIGVSGRVGGILPTNGDYSSTVQMNDYVDAGPYFGGRISYGINQWLGVAGGFDYSWMDVADEFRASSLEPALNFPMVFGEFIFNIGGLIKNNERVNPYLTAGAGVYPWKFTDDGVNGDPMFVSGNEFKKSSAGLNGGAGLEVFVIRNLTLFGETKYHYVFSQDEDEFGNSFEDTGYLGFGGGLTYYFNLK